MHLSRHYREPFTTMLGRMVTVKRPTYVKLAAGISVFVVVNLFLYCGSLSTASDYQTLVTKSHRNTLPVDQTPEILSRENVSTNISLLYKENLSGKYGLARISSLLHDTPEQWAVPRIVYFMWCGKKNFVFEHFLSLRSALAFLAPDYVYFYYDVMPTVDKQMYHTWFDELRELHPFIVTIQLKNKNSCQQKGVQQLHDVFEEMKKTGGIFLRENTVLTRTPSELKTESVVHALDEGASGGFLAIGRHNQLPADTAVQDLSQRIKTRISCTKLQSVKNHSCLILTQTGVLYPKSVMNGTGVFQRLARALLYGSPEVQWPIPHSRPQIPKIAHYVWYGQAEMDFVHYLSALSVLHILKVEQLYFHGDFQMTGKYWDELMNRSNVHWVYRLRPDVLNDNKIMKIEHKSDITTSDVIIKYGGMHLDPDVLFHRPLDDVFWQYDAVAGYDYSENHSPFPDLFNWGLKMGKRGAAFWRLAQQTQMDFEVSKWTWNSGIKIYKLYERNPSLVLFTPYLQVMCPNIACLPQWSTKADAHKLSANMTEWMGQVFSFHFCKDMPPSLDSIETVRNGRDPASQLGRTILQAAGFNTKPTL